MAYSAAYRQANRQKIADYRAAYWLKNRERIKAERRAKIAAMSSAELEAYAAPRRARSLLWRDENKERMRVYQANWYRGLSPDKKANLLEDCRKSRIKRLFGISHLEYDRLYQIQQGCCAICRVHQADLKHRLCVDHCHGSRTVRGLLCHNCNITLGLVHDDDSILLAAADYLRASRE